MAKCKYKYKSKIFKNKKCPHEALPGSDYCIWHKQEDGKDFSRQYIKETNLTEAYLVKANLEETRFKKGIRLKSANLQEANLQDTDLQGADLFGANLQGADLRYANLQGCILNEANLRGANLVGANLQGAHLQRCNLNEADLQIANLQGGYLYGASLQGCFLNEANLRGANLVGADLCGANLIKADLQEADLRAADLRGADLLGVSFRSIKNLRYARLSSWTSEEIMGDTLLKLGTAKKEDTDKYIKKFIEILENSLSSLSFEKETEKSKKKLAWRIVSFGGPGNIYDIGAVLRNSGRFYQGAFDIYLNLKNYFREDGLYDLSGIFFIGEYRARGKIQKVNYLLSFYSILFRIRYFFDKKINQLIRKKKDKQNFSKYKFSSTLSKDLRDLIDNLLGWIGNNILAGTSLYGESASKVLLTAILTIFVYAGFYSSRGGVTGQGMLHPTHNFLTSLYFSIVTFTTLGYGDLHPVSSIGMRLLAGSEAFLGAFILAYFVVVVSRKIMR